MKMLTNKTKKVNNLLVTFRGEILTLRQAISGGVVTAYMDSGNDNVVFLEINPSKIVESEMRVMLSQVAP